MKVSLFGTSSVEGERTLSTIVCGFGGGCSEELPSILALSDIERNAEAHIRTDETSPRMKGVETDIPIES